MVDTRLADQPNQVTDEQHFITRATVLKVFALVAVLSFILRIAYVGHLYEDDGLWFTAGEELLRGKALYREIYFDKPPGLALVYGLLFWIFGAHLLTIRLFTIAYSVATSALLFRFGAWLYNKHIGLLAAMMFAVFSTTYPHLQSLSSDFLMVLPYSAAAFLLVKSRLDAGSANHKRLVLAVAGGALAGVAFQINPKAVFALIFFVIFLVLSRTWKAADWKTIAGAATPVAPRVALLAGVGFLAGALPFLAYIAATRSASAYWTYVWDWGARYGSFHPISKIIVAALNSVANYLTLNNTLLIALGFVFVTTIRHISVSVADTDLPPGVGFRRAVKFHRDLLLLIWFAVSFAGVMLGGRFYAHYFLQTLPSLCLIGARGVTGISSSLRARDKTLRRGVMALLIIGFTFTLVRFHGRGVLLALDYARGTTSRLNATWYHHLRDREERMVAAVVRDLPDEADAADNLALEAIRAGGPRTREADGSSDYVFVWGYRPEIYFWSGLLPASRFLSSQPLTGVPADIHYFTDEYRSVLDENVAAKARAQLVQDLEATQPKYIVDEIGFFNGDLAILKYPELQDVMTKYKYIGSTGRFLIYIRRELRKKNLERD